MIGTAGWSIPRIYADRFPAEGSHLRRYGSVLRGAEINSSFYHSHRKSTYERWALSTPEHFRFAVKAPKAISHGVGDAEPAVIDQFLDEVSGLGNRLGPVLIQLPPKRAYSRMESLRLLSAFRERTNANIALEPRHASWFDSEVDQELVALKIARVAADPARAVGADRPAGWTGLVYYRLHGSPEIYRSSYGAEKLATISQDLLACLLAGSETWCIFDNTTSYAATGNALALLAM
ncbi:MAG: DUF72 domain-containing protein [Beijerinckiaceae bacterium]|nr:DUF72 domain-containing protein [Beijerinckiaceae bacterium]